jgi:hypothetical protein
METKYAGAQHYSLSLPRLLGTHGVKNFPRRCGERFRQLPLPPASAPWTLRAWAPNMLIQLLIHLVQALSAA